MDDKADLRLPNRTTVMSGALPFTPNVRPFIPPPAADTATSLFDHFCSTNTFHSILDTFQQLCDVLELRRDGGGSSMLRQLSTKLTSSWRAQSLWTKLEKRAGHWEYRKGSACAGTRVLVVGAGPCGLRVAIEIALLGGRAVVIEKRDSFSRNNVLHLWPHLIHDLKALGAKKFFGKFCAGSIDHISIRTLQCILLKVALVVGVEVYPGVSFEGLVEPPADQTISKIGWRAKLAPEDCPVSEYIFDVCISADGKRNTLQGFKKKEFRGKLAIAITANFINRNTQAEASVEEISGVSYIFNQKFFKDLNIQAGIDLENIVYYKDETHYFVMTAKKHSLLNRGVLIQDDDEPERLLSKDNVNQAALLDYARDAANISTRGLLPSLEFAHNHYGQPDVAMFDFTSMFASEYASRVVERQGYKLLVSLVGDTLLEPFWPIGSGCARGFLGALDAAWMVRSWASGKMTPLEVISERESIYQLLSQTTPENLNKVFGQHTIDPNTRYRNVNITYYRPHQVRHLYDSSDVEYINEIVRLSEEKSKRYDYLRDSHNLLKWFQRQLEPYRNIVKVVDLTTSWRNGLALCALIHLYRPKLLDVYALDQNEPVSNSQLAFDIAEKELGIAPTMSGYELVNRDSVDKATMVDYLSQFYEIFRKELTESESSRKEAAAMEASKVRSAAGNAFNSSGQMRNRKEEMENIDYNVRRHNPDSSSSFGVPSKRVRDVFGGENFELPSFMNTIDGQKEPGAKGQNKVSALAKDLASKFSGEKRIVEETRPAPKPVIISKPQLADVCYFCKTKVYIVERYTLRGILFHRNCLKCEYCGMVLRVTSYACQAMDSGELKFFCVQHNGLQRPAKSGSVTASVPLPGVIRGLSNYTKLCLSPPRNAAAKNDGTSAHDRVGFVKKPSERIEYTTESEIEETELEQTRHNLRCNLLRATAYSDSSSSEEELQFSDEEDTIDEGPDVAWQEMVWQSYRRKFAPPASAALQQHPPSVIQSLKTTEQPVSSGTDTETVGGASDADWETDTGTECEDDHDFRKATAIQKTNVDLGLIASGPSLSPKAPVLKETPSYAEIMRSRMAFFSAPSQPVRINARIFLGLDPMPLAAELPITVETVETVEELEKPDASDTKVSPSGELIDDVKTDNSGIKNEADNRNRKRHVRREQPERTKRRHKRRKKRPIIGQAMGTTTVDKQEHLPVVSTETTSSENGDDNETDGASIPDKAEMMTNENTGSVDEAAESESLSSGSQRMSQGLDRSSGSPSFVDANVGLLIESQCGSQESLEETSNTLQQRISESESESALPDELLIDDNVEESSVEEGNDLIDGRTLDSEKLFSEAVEGDDDESEPENISFVKISPTEGSCNVSMKDVQEGHVKSIGDVVDGNKCVLPSDEEICLLESSNVNSLSADFVNCSSTDSADVLMDVAEEDIRINQKSPTRLVSPTISHEYCEVSSTTSMIEEEGSTCDAGRDLLATSEGVFADDANSHKAAKTSSGPSDLQFVKDKLLTKQIKLDLVDEVGIVQAEISSKCESAAVTELKPAAIPDPADASVFVDQVQACKNETVQIKCCSPLLAVPLISELGGMDYKNCDSKRQEVKEHTPEILASVNEELPRAENEIESCIKVSHHSIRSATSRSKGKSHKTGHKRSKAQSLHHDKPKIEVASKVCEKMAPKAELDSFSDDDLQPLASEMLGLKDDRLLTDRQQNSEVVETSDGPYTAEENNVDFSDLKDEKLIETSVNIDSLLDFDTTSSINLSDLMALNTSLMLDKNGTCMEKISNNTVLPLPVESIVVSPHSAKAADLLLDELVEGSLEEIDGSCRHIPEPPPCSELRVRRESLPLDPLARIDRLLDSLSSSKVDAYFTSPPVGRSPKCSTQNKEKRDVSETSFTCSGDDSSGINESHVVEFILADESGLEHSYAVDEKFITMRDSHRCTAEEINLSSTLDSDESLAAPEGCPELLHQHLPDESSLNEPQNAKSSSYEEVTTANDDSLSLDCLPSFSLEDNLSLENVIDCDDLDIQQMTKSNESLGNGLNNHSKTSSEICVDRLKSQDAGEWAAGESPAVMLVSPSRMIDAKRRFFCEAPQPIRIDPRQVMDEIPSSVVRSRDVSIDRNGNCISDSPNRLSSIKNTESNVDNVPPASVSTVLPVVMDIADANVERTKQRRILPSVPSDPMQGALTSDELALIRNAQLPRKVETPVVGPSLSSIDDVSAARLKSDKRDKKRPSSALVEACDTGMSGISRLSPLQAKAHRIVSAAISKSPLERHRQVPLSSENGKAGDVSPSQVRREGSSWGFGRQKSKAKDLPVGGDPVIAEAQVPVADKKDKRRSLLALLMPSKNSSDKRDRLSKDSPSIVAPSVDIRPVNQPDIITSREKTKSLPLDKKGMSGPSQLDEGKQSALEKRKSKALKLKSGKKATTESLNVDGQTAVSMRTVYEEMAPIMEGIKHVERRNREKASIHERIQAVAPPPMKAPNTALLAPKADIEDFETESEIGDDRISLRSFQSQCHLPNDDEETASRHRRRQQKTALRKQREKELCRLHVAQEIQRQLQEVEQRQRDVEHRGIIIEKLLRGESPDPLKRPTSPQSDESALMQEWFDVVHEKNVLMSYESELAIHGRELELEDRQSRLETQLRERIPLTEVDRMPHLPDDEQRILQELVEVVQQRDALVALLEEERLKQQQYDRNLEKIMVERGFVMSPVSYLQQLRQPLAAMRGDDR